MPWVQCKDNSISPLTVGEILKFPFLFSPFTVFFFLAVRFGRIPKREKQRMLIEMQSAMTTMMNSQFGSSGPQEALQDYQASPSLLPPVPHPVEENAKAQQHAAKSRTPAASSSLPLPPSSLDISKEDVIGTVTRAHRETFMYNQEPFDVKSGASHQREDSVFSTKHNNNNIHFNNGINTGCCPTNERHNYMNGHERGKNNMGCPNIHAVYYPNDPGNNLSNGYLHKECSKTPMTDVSQAGHVNGYLCKRGRRMHLVRN